MSEKRIGRYEIQESLGRGAMGIVYKAYDSVLERYAALKVMNTGGEEDEELRSRFLMEARSAAKLNNPNVVAVYDLGEEQGQPFIAMEYVPGTDLRALIQGRVFMPFEQKLDCIIQVCRGLHYAHQNGVVHRDVKPGNLRLTEDGQVKILDFGLARLQSSDMTQTGMVMGTPFYMSPEQVRGDRDLDGRSDLFSLGVVFYEFIAFRKPFDADNPTAVCMKIVSDPHPSLSESLLGCSPRLVALTDRALNKERDARFQDGAEFAAAVEDFRAHLAEEAKQLRGRVEEEEDRLEGRRSEVVDLIEAGALDSELFRVERPSEHPDDYGTLLWRYQVVTNRLGKVDEASRQAVQLLKLLEEAEALLGQDDFEACLSVLQRLDALRPDWDPGRQLKTRCLERQEEVRRAEQVQREFDEAFDTARGCAESEDFDRALTAVERALELSPESEPARTLRASIVEESQRRRELDECLEQALAQEREGALEQSLETATRGLRLEPQHPELSAVSERVAAALKLRQDVAARLARATDLVAQGDLQGALGAVGEALEMAPDEQEAITLRARLQQQIERERRLLKLTEESAAQESAGDLQPALDSILKALEVAPGDAGLVSARERLEDRIEQEQAVRSLLDQAATQAGEGDLEAAVRSVVAALDVDPDNPQAQQLHQQLDEQLAERRRLEECVERARALEEDNDLAGALAAANAGLEIDPDHDELRVMATRTAQRQRIDSLLSRARDRMEADEFLEARRTLEELLSLDESHEEASRLYHTALERAAAEETEDRLSRLLAAAREDKKNRRYEACLRTVAEGLALDADNRPLQLLKSEVEPLLEAEGRLEQASQALSAENYDEALGHVGEALKLAPGSRPARQLRQKIKVARGAGLRVEEIVEQARQALEQEEPETAEALLEEGFNLKPDHEGLAALHRDVAAVRDRLSEINNLLADARKRKVSGDLEGAQAVLRELLGREPQHPEALTLQQQLQASVEASRLQDRIESLRARAASLLEAGDLARSLEAADEGLRLAPEDQRLRETRAAAASLLEQVESGVAEASRALEQGDVDRCDELVAAALQIFPGHEAARELQRQARQRAERAGHWERVEELRVRAQASLDAGDPETSIELSSEALELVPDDADLTSLREKAEFSLASEKRAEGREARVQAALESASRHYEEGRFKKGLADCETVLKLEPKNAEALRLRAQAAKALTQQQRFRTRVVAPAAAAAVVLVVAAIWGFWPQPEPPPDPEPISQDDPDIQPVVTEPAAEDSTGSTETPVDTLTEDQLAAAEPDNRARATAEVQAAQAALSAGLLDEAVSRFQSALQLDSGNQAAVAGLQEAMRRRAAVADEARLAELLTEGLDSVRQLRADGRLDEALQMAQGLRDQHRDSPELGQLITTLENDIASVAASDRERRDSALEAARGYVDLGNVVDSVRALRLYLRLDGDESEVLQIAEAHLEARRYGASLETFNLVAGRRPDDAALQARMQEIQSLRTVEEMVYVPAGTAHVGDDSGLSHRHYEQIRLPEFWIDKYEVTNLQYKRFVDDTGHRPPASWTGSDFPSGKALHPVTGVIVEDAQAYARWAGKRLPTDEEWDRAARGDSGWRFPWGNRFCPDCINSGSSDTESVTSRADGASPFGAMHMVGNALELTRNGIARGGSYLTPKLELALEASRIQTGKSGADDAGFRCVSSTNMRPE